MRVWTAEEVAEMCRGAGSPVLRVRQDAPPNDLIVSPLIPASCGDRRIARNKTAWDVQARDLDTGVVRISAALPEGGGQR
jgi:hypothetical protein